MGGCRCSYRNCTARSDGKTHLFHYPVFDKVRCHQWLKNANKLDFLDLKVSQLKNRVVCQNHFRNEDFMNFRKDKLKFDAVPTENGPYCSEGEQEISQEFEKAVIMPEDIENDQLTMLEKQANYKVKYADFLINSDGDIKLSKNYNSQNSIYNEFLNSQNTIKNEFDLHNSGKGQVLDVNTSGIFCSQQSQKPKRKVKTLMPKNDPSGVFIENLNKTNTPPSQVTNKLEFEIPVLDSSNRHEGNTKKSKIKILSEKKISGPVNVPGKLEPVPPTLVLQPRDKNRSIPNPEMFDSFSYYIPQSNAIIVNDQPSVGAGQTSGNISEVFTHYTPVSQPTNSEIVESKPILLESNLQNENAELCFNVIPGNSIISVGHSQNDALIETRDDQQMLLSTPGQSNIPGQCNNNELLELLPSKQLQNKSSKHLVESPTKLLQNKTFKNVEDNYSNVKSKIPAERVAAIEEKRKFNKKLRDMIEFCLDELDEPVKKNGGSPTKTIGTENKQKNNEKISPKVVDSPKTNLPGNQIKIETNKGSLKVQEKIPPQKFSTESNSSISPMKQSQSAQAAKDVLVSSLEAKLQTMEDLLIKKIEDNAKQISELKKSFNEPPVRRLSTITQTVDAEETHKKMLFQELSKYLSANTSSLVYEELFLNKFSKNRVLHDSSEEVQVTPKRRRRR